MVELTEVEQKIFDKIIAEYHRRNIIPDEEYLKKIIKLGNTNGDGYKRVSKIGEDKIYLVPIETIILHGLRAQDLDKYPVEER